VGHFILPKFNLGIGQKQMVYFKRNYYNHKLSIKNNNPDKSFLERMFGLVLSFLISKINFKYSTNIVIRKEES
jgi:hypothetical protein